MTITASITVVTHLMVDFMFSDFIFDAFMVPIIGAAGLLTIKTLPVRYFDMQKINKMA